MHIHLVTGGSGFVGNALVKNLLERGHHVRVLDIIAPKIHHPNLEFYQGSILHEDHLNRAFQNVHAVYHLAAAVPLVQSERAFEEINIQGTKLVYAATQKAQARHFTFMSSSAVYGNAVKSNCPITEQHETRPFESYGKSKVKAEQFLLQKMNQAAGPTCTIIRPRTILGPGRLGIFHLLFSWIYHNQPLFFIGDGSNLLQLIHVQDLANACVLASEKKAQGIFNIGAKSFRPLKDSIAQLCLHANSTSKIQAIPAWLAISALYLLDKAQLSPFSAWHYKTFHRDYYFDIQKAENELGWKPIYSNDEMLIESYDWFKNHFSHENLQASIHQRPLQSRLTSLFLKSKPNK